MIIINFIHIPKNGGNSIREICYKIPRKIPLVYKNIPILSNIMIYNGHNTDVYNKNLSNQLVVIRNPIDRFISAVNYSLQKFSNEPHVKYLIENKIDTPEKWIQIWMNPKDKQYPYLIDMIKNKNHKIGNRLIEYRWTYSSQSLWINNPKFVIIMDNFNVELQYFIKKYNIKLSNISKKNSTRHKDDKLSTESINFLKNIYKEDFILYEKYKNISIEERL